MKLRRWAKELYFISNINQVSIEKMLQESLKDDSIKGSTDMLGLRDWPTRRKENTKKTYNPNKVNIPVNIN